MIDISIPGFKNLQLEFLVLDFNGTLACDGLLLPGIKEQLTLLSNNLIIHILTADTFGRAKEQLEGIPCQLAVLSKDHQEVGKLDHINRLGADRAVCIGNGRNDRLMLEKAGLGIAVIQEEGAAKEAILAADIISPNIISALELLKKHLRLTATLRS